MKKITIDKKHTSIGLIIAAYVVLVVGITFLLVGCLKEKYLMIYTAIAFILASTLTYSILIIYGLIYYFKHRR